MDKAEERYYLGVTLRLRPDFAVSDIEPTEAPDFLARSDGKVIGIELVRFLLETSVGPSPAAVDNYRNQLARKLTEEHVARGIPPVHVSVHFAQDEKLLAPAERRKLAERLLAFIGANLPAIDSSAEFDYNNLPDDLCAMGLHALHVISRKALTKPFWGLPHASWIPESTPDRVQALVDKKASNLRAYRQRVQQLWLVIISGTQGLQSIQDLDGGLLDAEYATEFDRVFLLRTFGGVVHELKCRPP